MDNEKQWVHRKMVGWYDPLQLIDTGVQVAVSELIGSRSDYRVIEGLSPAQAVFDYATEPEIWIDYVADLGDGWDSTYAIASTLAAEQLELRARAAGPVATARGRILIMGGDEVYPTADRDAYQERTVGPYACALEESSPPHPELFAIPGNHDWYDGLVSFSRLFCQGRWFGGWQTRQRRSYFALRLPHRWWIWGVDIQLESDVDQPQVEYFRAVAQSMQPGDRVILVTAEPHWVYGNIYDSKYQKSLAFLEENIINGAGASLQVALAGDLHHYRRHESVDDPSKQLITSGGGGAFLHPTYGPSVSQITMGKKMPVTYQLKAAYPTERTCKRLLLRNLLFPFINPQFGLFTGLMYLVLAWLLQPSIERELSDLLPGANSGMRLDAFLRAILESPSGVLWIVVIIAGFIFFTDTHSRIYKFAAGGLHALSHLAGVLATAIIASLIVGPGKPLNELSSLQLIGRAIAIFLGGYLIGSFLMGMYLCISLRVFRRHSNEAFSSLRIPDYKNFLRLHIGRDGGLTIYPVGIEQVPRVWTAAVNPTSDKPQLVPGGNQQVTVHLIESPIRV